MQQNYTKINLLKGLGLAAVFFLISAWITYRYFPGTIIKGLQKIAVWDANLTKKKIEIDGYIMHYYEGGVGNDEVLILLHGLGDDKNSFVRSVAELSETYRIILPDLAGHGENSNFENNDYSIHGQVKFLKKFVHNLGIPSFHIGGNSMGGHIATAFAHYYPTAVKGLILLNATGMELSDKMVYRYFPDQLDDQLFDEMISLVFAERPKIPAHFMNYFRLEMNKKIPFLNTLIRQIMEGEDFRLNEKIRKIAVPTFVLWGQHDQIVPWEHAEAFHQGLQNSKLQYLEHAAHSPQIEIPKTVQYEIEQFIKSTWVIQ